MAKPNQRTFSIYTDGSCNSKFKIGAWAAYLFSDELKVLLQGKETNTTHQRMELLAVIKSLAYIINSFPYLEKLKIYSDSQYVVDLVNRKEKLKKKDFLTRKEAHINNFDLVKPLIDYLDSYPVELIKLRAHSKQGKEAELNQFVDKVCRKMVRDNVKNMSVEHEKKPSQV